LLKINFEKKGSRQHYIGKMGAFVLIFNIRFSIWL
jgi:hypothetical protein